MVDALDDNVFPPNGPHVFNDLPASLESVERFMDDFRPNVGLLKDYLKP